MRPYTEVSVLPAMYDSTADTLMIIRGYGYNHRIEYSAATVVAINQLEKSCRDLLVNDAVAYLHIRGASTNCYQFRVERGV